MRLLRLSIVLAVSVAALAVVGTAGAAVLYVSPSTVVVPPFGTSCTFPGSNSIQAAVTVANPGDTIVVCDGVYSEQVTVSKSLTLSGSGNSIVQPPTTTLAGNGDVVTVNGGATVQMSGFIVRGPGPGGCASIQAGIRVTDDATLNLNDTAVRDIADNPFGGCQNGEGIRVGTRGTQGGAGHLVADRVTVERSQKNGITANGAGTTAKITNTTVTGSGSTSVIAQNGIQVSRGAAATISTSTIRDHSYAPKSFVACGLLIFDANGVNDQNNVYLNNEKDKCGGSRGGTYEGAP
jgi:hypothetical protein